MGTGQPLRLFRDHRLIITLYEIHAEHDGVHRTTNTILLMTSCPDAQPDIDAGRVIEPQASVKGGNLLDFLIGKVKVGGLEVLLDACKAI